MLEEGAEIENIPHDFTEGLKRILQAIYANISSYIISPTLAHHIVITGSRFMFSHETKPLLLAQMEDYLHGKNMMQRFKIYFAGNSVLKSIESTG